MLSNSHDFIRPANASDRAYLESLVRAEYDRTHPGETFDDMKRRMSFSREDQGLYRDWIALATARAAQPAKAKPIAANETINHWTIVRPLRA